MTDPDDLRMMFDSKYIGAWDLPEHGVTVTISRIVAAEVKGEGGRTDKAPIVHFKGWSKPMVMNKTNMKTIGALYSTFSAKALVGKRVTLYATKCQGAKGGTVDCIRVRNAIPDEPGVPQEAVGAKPVDQAMRRRQVEQAGG